MKKVVAVLFGGKSSEYEISLMSASSIIRTWMGKIRCHKYWNKQGGGLV